MVLYAMVTVGNDETGKTVCVSRIKGRQVRSWTDENAAEMLEMFKQTFLKKLGYKEDEVDCVAEYIPLETFYEYAGPTAVLNEMEMEILARKRRANKELEE